MDLFIIRHAWAVAQGDPRWPIDAQRPLTPEGKQRFARLVELLVERGFAPSIVAASPAVRCRQTAEIISRGLIGAPEVVPRDELLGDGDLTSLLTWTDEQAGRHEQIAWVGHAPDVGRMTAALVGPPESYFHFGKGSVAAIRFDDLPEIGRGELRWLVTPKLLGI
jgi:phosphohistidine phosphatase